jgi:diadenosine tetraphosphate (Ap4A) HIT family hydrolase
MTPTPLTYIHSQVESSRAGTNPTVIARMPSGWAVIGDHQFLSGYCLLLADPVVTDLTDLDHDARQRFLLDMSLLGEAVLASTPAYRMNYEILGNSEPALHAHVLPRFHDEPDEYRRGPAWLYPADFRATNPYSPAEHGELQAAIGQALQRLLA